LITQARLRLKPDVGTVFEMVAGKPPLI